MRFDSLTLTSRDLDRSRTFYLEKLGFPLVEEKPEGFVIDAGGVKLKVAADGPRSPLTQAEPRLVFLTASLQTRCMVLRDLGVSVDGPHRIDGRGLARLADPDGHPITLVEA